MIWTCNDVIFFFEIIRSDSRANTTKYREMDRMRIGFADWASCCARMKAKPPPPAMTMCTIAGCCWCFFPAMVRTG